MDDPNDANSVMDWFKRHGLNGGCAGPEAHSYQMRLTYDRGTLIKIVHY